MGIVFLILGGLVWLLGLWFVVNAVLDSPALFTFMVGSVLMSFGGFIAAGFHRYNHHHNDY